MAQQELTQAEAFLYPSTVSIYRTNRQTGVGLQTTYAAQRPADDAPVPGLSNLPCSLQAQTSGGGNPVALPTDSKRSLWHILLPAWAAARGSIKRGDEAVDDLGNRYTIEVDGWGPLGYRLQAAIEEA